MLMLLLELTWKYFYKVLRAAILRMRLILPWLVFLMTGQEGGTGDKADTQSPADNTRIDWYIWLKRTLDQLRCVKEVGGGRQNFYWVSVLVIKQKTRKSVLRWEKPAHSQQSQNSQQWSRLCRLSPALRRSSYVGCWQPSLDLLNVTRYWDTASTAGYWRQRRVEPSLQTPQL